MGRIECPLFPDVSAPRQQIQHVAAHVVIHVADHVAAHVISRGERCHVTGSIR